VVFRQAARKTACDDLEQKMAQLERESSALISVCDSLKARTDELEVGKASLMKEGAKVMDLEGRLEQAGREIEALGMERSGLFARLKEVAEQTSAQR